MTTFGSKMELSHYLYELRKRLIYTLYIYGTLLILFFFFAQDLFHLITLPVLKALPNKQPLIATNLTASFLTPINLAANLALVCTLPFGLLQIWQFIVPGLYAKERMSLQKIILLSVSLFCIGILFCFFIVLPILIHFFINSLPKEVQLLPDITLIVNFIIRILLLFGLCFQVPLICVFLAKINLLSYEAQKSFRPYAIVGAFIIGMLFTPPDILSQITLAIPLCLLYELGLLLIPFFC